MGAAVPTAVYLAIRERVPFRTVELGSSSLILYEGPELIEGQLGYSRHPDGTDLTGTPPERWCPDWLVIGYDGSLGDPVFVDRRDAALPVYTAMHGCGEWRPMLVARSFNGFIGALQRVRDLGPGREHPIALEQNPVSDADREAARHDIAAHLRCDAGEFLSFWPELSAD